MNSKRRFCSILSMLIAASWLGSIAGCTQADNPTPVKAEAPPPPKDEELKVPNGPGGKPYGSGDAYKKAMERAAKQSSQ